MALWRRERNNMSLFELSNPIIVPFVVRNASLVRCGSPYEGKFPCVSISSYFAHFHESATVSGFCEYLDAWFTLICTKIVE